MRDTQYWLQKGFRFGARFQDEYDLWVDPKTMQRLRRYINGDEWLTDLNTGEYKKLDKDEHHET